MPVRSQRSARLVRMPRRTQRTIDLLHVPLSRPRVAMRRADIRNIAIIAHVDHGKTTLVDAMLRQSHIFRDNQQVAERVMDSGALERERGITIMAKNTAIVYRGTKINIVDTPGHADFGGEVERVMNMVDGVLLLVDAVDGPMPQTKFVLRQALRRGHRAIVVINKIDRPNARPVHVLNETFDLFLDLGAANEQAEFMTVYTNAIIGAASTDHRHIGTTLEPLFDAIVENIPAPDVDADAPAQLLVTTTTYDDYKGKIAVGRLQSGVLRRAQPVMRIDHAGALTPARVTQLFTFQGLAREEVDEARAGDIVAVAGVADVGIGDTIADAADPRPLPPIRVEEPTLRMTFAVNTSPFSGREGTHVTSRKLRERLYAELERDVALRVADTDSPDTLVVSGRGELHLAILIETLRREGYEFQVSRPEVIYKDEGGQRLEPYEQLEVEVAQDVLGQVVVNTLFAGYGPYAGAIESRDLGSLIAFEAGTTTTFGLNQAQERGQLFIGPGVEVYEGMVVGEHIRDRDLEVNVVRRKHLTNMRSSNSDIAAKLDGMRELSLDDAVEFLADDELLEVTPVAYRIRKRMLAKQDRDRLAGQRKKAGVAV